MDDRQRAKLKMYKVVRLLMNESTAVTSPIPKYAEVLTPFDAKVSALDTLSQQQKKPSTGVTEAKDQLNRAMTEAVMPVVGGLIALAKLTKDPDLAAQAAFTRSDFLYEAEADAADNADIVHGLATTHATALADFGVTQAAIDSVDTAVEAFRNAMGTPRQTIIGTASKTTQIAATLIEIDELLESMDALAEVVRPAHPNFYTEYQSAREIIDPGSSSGDDDTSGSGSSGDDTSGGSDTGGTGTDSGDSNDGDSPTDPPTDTGTGNDSGSNSPEP